MNKMKATSQCPAQWICTVLFAALVFHANAADELFTINELKQFLTNSVPFIEWVRTNHQERALERLIEKPESIKESPEAVRFLQDRKWEPERFAYILNHVIVAYKRLGMGKEPSQLLARLEQTKIAVRADASQSESDKANTLAIVAEAQRDARKTDKAFAALPPEEVRLMWLHRTELHDTLDGHLFSKRILPDPARRP